MSTKQLNNFHKQIDENSNNSEPECDSPDHKGVEIKRKKKAQSGPKQQLVLCTKDLHYNVVKRVCRKMAIRLEPDENQEWDIYWSDIAVVPDKFKQLKPYQRLNANPNIALLARKNNLAKHLTRMMKESKEDYDFFPKTWQLPFDANDLKNQFTKKGNKTFIIKPVHLCQGRGIYLVRRYEDIEIKPNEQLVA